MKIVACVELVFFLLIASCVCLHSAMREAVAGRSIVLHLSLILLLVVVERSVGKWHVVKLPAITVALIVVAHLLENIRLFLLTRWISFGVHGVLCWRQIGLSTDYNGVIMNGTVLASFALWNFTCLVFHR